MGRCMATTSQGVLQRSTAAKSASSHCKPCNTRLSDTGRNQFDIRHHIKTQSKALKISPCFMSEGLIVGTPHAVWIHG
jgi:hypothetical protein